MALEQTNLVRVASVPYGAGDAKSKWLYATADALAIVKASDYFSSATKRINKGDTIEVLCALGGTPVAATLVVTSATRAATVTTALSNDPGGVAGAQTAIADLGAISATLSTSNTYTDAAVKASIDAAILPIQQKVDAILAMLRTSGLLASS